MGTINRRTKEQVRRWMFKRWTEHTPLPDLEQIRHELNPGAPHGKADAAPPLPLKRRTIEGC